MLESDSQCIVDQRGEPAPPAQLAGLGGQLGIHTLTDTFAMVMQLSYY